MSGRGNCYDNAVMEHFFLNLKMERVWQTHYANHADAVKDISQYIVAFYNGCRLHSSLGYLSPNQFEAKLTENQPIMSIEVSNFSWPLQVQWAEPTGQLDSTIHLPERKYEHCCATNNC